MAELIKNTKQELVLEFEDDDKLLSVPIDTSGMKKAVLFLRRLIGGKELFKDIPHLLLKIFKIYSPYSSMDLVHFEVLLSQCLRDKERPILPARIGPDPENPILANIKKNIFSTSFIGGLAFENIGVAINVGLTAVHELQPSILEKVLLGKIVESADGDKKK